MSLNESIAEGTTSQRYNALAHSTTAMNHDDLIAAQTQKHEALKTHKKGLMQQLVPTVAGASSSKDSETREQDAPPTLP